MKTFVEESQTLIRAPVQVVWKTLRQFEAWPTWSSLIKEVRSVPQGWRFRTHGVELVDQFGVIRPKSSSQPYRLEWEAVRDQPHNLVTQGSIQLEHTPLGTHLFAHLEFEPDYPSPMLEHLAEFWVLTFAEPSKTLGTFLNDLKTNVEQQDPLVFEQTQPLVRAQPAA